MPETALPPGPKWPVLAQTMQWILRPMGMMEAWHRRYGDMFTVQIRSEGTWVFVSRPDLVKEVFTGPADLLHAGEANVILQPIVGRRSVLLLDDEHHMRERKLLLPPFHGQRMQRYGELMREVAEREIDRWPTGVAAPSFERTQAITLEIIIRAVFGVEEPERVERMRTALRSALDWTTGRARLLLLATLGPERTSRRRDFQRVMAPVDALIFEEVARRRADPAAGERDDILSMLLQARHEDGRGMTDEELRDELMTLLVAGHETTATALSWALEELSRHPAALARLTEEAAAGEGHEFADAVVRETLRLRPVLAIVLRRLTAPMELGGYDLPAGTSVAPCIYLMHRRPDVYPFPAEFRPERFLEGGPSTYEWIPFGGGVRRCLGASFAQFEMRVVLETLLSRMRPRTTRTPPERPRRRAITMTPERGGVVMLDPA